MDEIVHTYTSWNVGSSVPLFVGHAVVVPVGEVPGLKHVSIRAFIPRIKSIKVLFPDSVLIRAFIKIFKGLFILKYANIVSLTRMEGDRRLPYNYWVVD